MITKQIFINHIPSEIEEHYEVNPDCIGQGGFGKVFEARKRKRINSQQQLKNQQDKENINERQMRAIKQITLQRPQDKSLMKNEIEILSYLDHPTIVKLYETFEHKKQLYLVTDLLKGGDLFQIIGEQYQCNQEQVKLIFEQLIKALSYLHSQHICHRDLKLQNILFIDEHSYNIKLIDFGLAFCWDEDMKRQIKQSGQGKKMAGTPDYMSPQMLNYNYDERCDIWSAGVVLYMLLSGISPFAGDTPQQTTVNVKNVNYTFEIPQFDNISKSAKDLLYKIFKPEDKRISLQQIFAHPWLEHRICECVTHHSNRSSGKSVSSMKTASSKALKTKPICLKSLKRIHLHDNAVCKNHENCRQQLTTAKLQYYSHLSKLQKLFAIYSISQLSQGKVKAFGRQFILLDKNHDGTVSLEDLSEYLEITQKFSDKEKLEFYFDSLSISQRKYISYTQYLACVLAYQSATRVPENNVMIAVNVELAIQSQSLIEFDPINIYDEHVLQDLFLLLDKDKDGFICKQDFAPLLESNPCIFKLIGSEYEELNNQLLEQVENKIKQIAGSVESISQKAQEDPRKFKQLLSRTYKGSSDGGPFIDYKHFKQLIKCHYKL